MRLDARTRDHIRKAAKMFFDAEPILFGSRLDDHAKGGDIDIYIRTALDDKEIAERRIKMLAYLLRHLGERKIDLVIDNGRAELPIYEEARRRGVSL